SHRREAKIERSNSWHFRGLWLTKQSRWIPVVCYATILRRCFQPIAPHLPDHRPPIARPRPRAHSFALRRREVARSSPQPGGDRLLRFRKSRPSKEHRARRDRKHFPTNAKLLANRFEPIAAKRCRAKFCGRRHYLPARQTQPRSADWNFPIGKRSCSMRFDASRLREVFPPIRMRSSHPCAPTETQSSRSHFAEIFPPALKPRKLRRRTDLARPSY